MSMYGEMAKEMEQKADRAAWKAARSAEAKALLSEGRTEEEMAALHREDAESIVAKQVARILALFEVLDDTYTIAVMAAGHGTPKGDRLQESWAKVEAGLDMLRRMPK